MRLGRLPLAACAAVLLLWPETASGQTTRLTLSDALSRARERGPRVITARLALEETRGRLVGAGLRFQTNPELEAALGRRHGTESSTDLQIGIQQVFEPPGRRAARMTAASHAVTQGTAQIDDTTRIVLHETAAAFLRAVHAQQRILLLRTAEAVAAQIHTVADRRFKAGDIPVLDVNIARASLGRVRADLQSAAAVESAALGDLRQLLGIDGEVVVDHAFTRPEPSDLTALMQSAIQRPEVRRLEAAISEAEADMRLARTYRRPDFGVGARYEREEGDQVILGGVTISLPTFAKGQELLAVSSATLTRLRSELDAERFRIRLEVAAALDTYRRRLEAVRVLSEEALAGLDENERLTARSFEVGQLGLAELLLIRREILDTRFQYLDTLLEAELARVDLDASAGGLR